MNEIRWFNFEDTDADKFRIYRSIPGFAFLLSSLTAKTTFRFSATSPDRQSVDVDNSSPSSVITSLNKARGLSASLSEDGTKVYVRLTATTNARLKIYSSSFATAIGLSPQIIVPELSFQEMIAEVPFVNGNDPYSFVDADGSYLDSYYISSVKELTESLASVIQSPQISGYSYCILEGRFKNIQGRPVKGIRVGIEPSSLPADGLSTNKLSYFSDELGRVSIPLLKEEQYVLHIPAIGYNGFVDTGSKDFLNLENVLSTLKPEFSTFGDIS